VTQLSPVNEIMQTAYDAHAEDHDFARPGTLVRTAG
jgi:hypothetical protein